MSFIKQIDYFKKVSFDIEKSTLFGAILSIISITTMALLLLNELGNFFSSSIKKDAIIYNNNLDNNIAFDFNIVMYSAPCQLISLEHMDEKGVHFRLNEQKILRVRVDEVGTPLPVNPELSIVDSLNKRERCHINGEINLQKTPGLVRISPNLGNMYALMRHSHPNFDELLSLKHKFLIINFGHSNDHAHIYKRFGFDSMEVFNRANFPDFTNDTSRHFDYFIKIIPHLLVDETWGTETMAYQYSINHLARKSLPNGREEAPSILLRFELSDVTIKVTLESKSFLHFLTHVCAIIGGVYVIFSILSRILISLFDGCCEDNKAN